MPCLLNRAHVQHGLAPEGVINAVLDRRYHRQRSGLFEDTPSLGKTLGRDGDVIGHRMRAALVIAIMRDLVEELMPVAGDAGRFLSEINRSLHAILRRSRERFIATAFYLIADVATHEIRYASAGRSSPLRIERSRQHVESLKNWDERHGPALGLFERPSYATCYHSISDDESFLLFTDAIYEANDSRSEGFGQPRVPVSVRRHLPLAADDLFDSVIQDVQRFTGSPGLEDDVCLVGIDVTRLTGR